MINLKIIIPLVVILVLAIVIGLLTTETWSPSWNPFRTPSLAIENSLSKTIEAETFKITGEVGGEFQSGQEPESKIITAALVYSGNIDKSEKGKIKNTSDLNLELGMEGITLQIKGKMISWSRDIYLKITSLPSLPLSGFDLEEIKNQWIKIDTEKLKEISGEKEPFAIDEETEKKFLEDLKNLLIGKEIFKVKKNFGEEELEGVKVNHYSTEVNKEALKVLIPEILKLTKKYIPAEEQATYEKDLEKFLEDFSNNFDQAWGNIEPLEFDFWIGKDNFLRRLKFEKELEYGSLETEDVGKVKLRVDLKFSDFNEKVEIEIPENFKSIEEFLTTSTDLSEEEYYIPDFDSESIPEFEFYPEE